MAKTRRTKLSGVAVTAAQAYRAALARLARGEGRHTKHSGRVVRITPASVAREARRSRNPLYTTHRDILAEIEAATELPLTTRDLGARIEELEGVNRALRAELRQAKLELQSIATENLALLHRTQTAEARLALRKQK
jgi:hypothetical protein